MASEKPQFQPWNEEEFQADVFVRGMSWIQRHFYRALLQAAFFHSTRPYLPTDDEVLWVLAGAENQEQWVQNKAKVVKRFTAVEDHPELMENKRVTADWFNWKDIRDEAVESGAMGGKKSAEARRMKYGTAQPVRVLTPEGVSKAPFEGGSENAEGSRRVSEAREVKVSEVKERKDKQNGDDGSSSKRATPADWKNIAVRYRNVFGKKAGAEFKKKYYDACDKYTEDVVLECFDLWATEGKREWCEANGFDKPLHLFFKKLPDEAEDAVEVNTEIKRQKTEKVEKQKQQVAAEEKSVAIQNKEIIEQFAVKPQTNTAVIDEDFFKE